MKKKKSYLVYIVDVYRRWHLVHKTKDLDNMLAFTVHPSLGKPKELQIRIIK
jgi:hypothetical protein